VLFSTSGLPRDSSANPEIEPFELHGAYRLQRGRLTRDGLLSELAKQSLQGRDLTAAKSPPNSRLKLVRRSNDVPRRPIRTLR